jgi:hypothetical protein
MQTLSTEHVEVGVCAICGNRKSLRETWFVITENHRQDRLDIWKHSQTEALRAGAYWLCGPKHVRELVVHWMTTGCLQYPFAASCQTALNHEIEFAPLSSHNARQEALSSRLCEIAVDREGIMRALRENPLSLNTILDEMIIALQVEAGEHADDDFEMEDCFALSGLD